MTKHYRAGCLVFLAAFVACAVALLIGTVIRLVERAYSQAAFDAAGVAFSTFCALNVVREIRELKGGQS